MGLLRMGDPVSIPDEDNLQLVVYGSADGGYDFDFPDDQQSNFSLSTATVHHLSQIPSDLTVAQVEGLSKFRLFGQQKWPETFK